MLSETRQHQVFSGYLKLLINETVLEESILFHDLHQRIGPVVHGENRKEPVLHRGGSLNRKSPFATAERFGHDRVPESGPGEDCSDRFRGGSVQMADQVRRHANLKAMKSWPIA